MRRRPRPVVKAYYWTKKKNFGDLLAPYLLNRFANVDCALSTPEDADVAVIGSILHHLPPDFAGTVLGCGNLYPTFTPQLQNATVLALRGPLTAPGYKGGHAIGDPGLLAPELVTPTTKVWRTAIVPHLTDHKLETMREFVAGPDSIVVHPWRDPLWVAQTIAESRRVVTSSLHGTILADAFGIPRRVIHSTTLDNPNEGGRFKWQDYSAAIDMPIEVGKFQLANRDKINDIRDQLADAFEVFGKSVRDRTGG